MGTPTKDFSKFERTKNEANKFHGIGSATTAVNVNDVTVSTNKLSVSAESVSFSAGAAGTTGVVTLDKAPIYNNSGNAIGNPGDTSFAWVTGTVLTTEIDFRTDQDNTTQLAAMSSGEYAIDYFTGLIRYKKATTGTSDTCNYTSRQMNVEMTGSSVTASNNIAQLNGQTINLGAGAVDTGTQRVTLSSDDGAVVGIQSVTTSVQIMDDWDEVHGSACGTDGALIMGYATSAQPTVVDNADAARLTMNLYGESVIAGYDWATSKVGTTEADPISLHHVEETIAAVTNGTDTSGTYYYIDLDGYRYLSLHGELSGGSGTITATVELSVQDDGTVPASCAYQDVTQYGFDNMLGAAAAAYNADFVLAKKDVLNGKYVRLKIQSSTGGANDGDWTIYSKKWY